MQVDHYCEHFKNLKLTKTIEINEQSSCKYCMFGKTHLWLCLSKNCRTFVCDRNSKEHLLQHLQQTRAKKSFHSIYINVLTAKIICIHCQIEIHDLDQVKNINRLQQYQNPYPLRLKILPALAQFDFQKCKGQLENSEGHRRMNKALTGLFGNKYNHSINSAIQFMMQFKYYRSILFQLKLSAQSKILHQLRQIFIQAQSAQLRAIRTDELTKLLYERNPQLLGYSRKDPFDHIIMFMNLVHEQIKYYSVQSNQQQRDEWELLSKSPSSVILNCPLYDSFSCSLSIDYECQECKIVINDPANINFIKLNFPKKKRKVKEVQKQLVQHRCTSPLKKRNSLVNFFMPQQQCPFTVTQLIIDLLKNILHKEKKCNRCKNNMAYKKPYFSNLSDYLIIVINRMAKDGNSINDNPLQLDFNPLDMGPFTQNKDNVILYDIETVLCLQKGCLFPVIAVGQSNKQRYIFKNQFVSLLKSQKEAANPYILCYKKRIDEVIQRKRKDIYNNVTSNITIINETMKLEQNQYYLLPDFWINQLQFSILKPLNNQLVCGHGYRKPNVNSKMITSQKVPNQVYEYLVQEYGGELYRNKQCQYCNKQLQQLVQRRRIQKQRIIEYDKIKTKCYCMISSQWIKKWMNFLYFKGQYAYFSKGYYLPGPIENKELLQGTKCKKSLHRNVDYKVVNIFVWRFLKDLYGGGPQIRYKWKQNQLKKFQQQKIQEVRKIAKEVKQMFRINYPISPMKSMIIQRTSSFVESVSENYNETELDSELCQQKQEEVEVE